MSHDKDYIERWRRTYYPKLHKYLTIFNLYSVGKVGEAQYAGTLSIGEEEIERLLLHESEFKRNALAAYKSHRDGRESTLSLRLTHSGSEALGRTYVEPGMQLHLTFLPARDAREGRLDVYAHYEDDWAVSPIAHLRSTNFSAKQGVKRATALFRQADFLEEGDNWYPRPMAENSE